MSNINTAIKELEDLFSTKAKDNIIYFNDVTYTPIPQPVAEAVKTIMSEYPDLGYQLGLYSVKILEQNVHPNNHVSTIQNSVNKNNVESSTKIGNLHDDFVTCRINEVDAIKKLMNENGFTKVEAKSLLDKWRPDVIKQSFNDKPLVKSSLSEYFPVSEEEAEELDSIAETFGDDRSELRSVLEDYFHIYDDYAEMTVQEFDSYLADYFRNND